MDVAMGGMDGIVTEAYVLHRAALLRRLVMLTRNETVAEDLCQESYARLVKEMRSGHSLDNPAAWLHRVAGNLVVSNARRAVVADKHAREFVTDASDASAEIVALGRERAHELNGALGRLSTADRSVLLLAASGASGREMSQALGSRAGAARTRLLRARRHLGRELAAPAGMPTASAVL